MSSTPHDFRSAKPSAGRALIAFVLFNVLAQTATLWLSRDSVLGALQFRPRAFDLGLFASYYFALFSVAALALLALGFLLIRGIGERALYVVFALESLVAFAALLDPRVYAVLGVHLNDPMVVTTLSSANAQNELQASLGTVASVLGALALVLLFEAALLTASRRLSDRFAHWPARKIAAALALPWALALCGANWAKNVAVTRRSPVLETLALFERLNHAFGPGQDWMKVRYPTPKSIPIELARKPTILFILAESFRRDMLSPELTPTLDAFSRSADCLRSHAHFSGGHTTEIGTFSALFSVYPHDYYPFSAAHARSFPLEALRANGYRLIGGGASKLKSWGAADLMVEQFDEYREFLKKSDRPGDDRRLVEWIAEMRLKAPKGEPRLYFAFLNATHHNYYYPPEFAKDQPALPEDYNFFLWGPKLKEHRQELINRYRNSVRYVDSSFAKLLEAFKEDIERKNLIVVFSGDHGEELWDTGSLGHASPTFADSRIHVPLVFCGPGLGGHEVALSSHVDLLPTILDLLRAGPNPLETSSFSDGSSLLALEDPNRQLMVMSLGFPYERDQFVLIDRETKTWLKANGPLLSRFDVVRRASLGDEPKPGPRASLDLSARLRRFVTPAH